MGVYADLLANAKAWDAGGPDEMKVGIDRVITMQIERFLAQQNDIPYPSDYAVTDEVQEIGTYNGSVSGGSFTLSLTLADGTTFTTVNTIHNANNSIIETSIDEQGANFVTGWTNGDILVTGGNMTTTPIVLTYSGSTVNGANHAQVVINDVDLSGGGTVGDVSTTTNGQTDRPAMAALNAMGVIDSPPPAQGSYAGLTATSTRESNPFLPRQEVLQALAMQAAIEDDADGLYAALMTAMGLERLL